MAAQKTAKIIKRVPHFKTVLVTGAASYLGSKLCEKLLRQGFRVVGLDSSSTSFSNPRFIFLKADLKDALPKELQAVDYIFHLASNHYHTHAKEKDTLQSFLTNTEGTKRLLDFAVSCKAQFLQGSSVEIYKSITSALSIKNYFGETEEEKAKNSFFESKRVAESLVWEYVRGGKIDARIARLPNVYGPGFLGEGADNELSGFIAALGRGDAIVVYGEGLDKEFYNYVDDITDGLIKAQFDSDSEGKIYPLCDLEGVTTLELAYLVKSLARKDIDVEFKPGVEKEYPEYRVTDGQTLKDLGWEPKVGLKEGIGKTVGAGSNSNFQKPIPTPKPKSKEDLLEEAVPLVQRISAKLEKAPKEPKLPKEPREPEKHELSELHKEPKLSEEPELPKIPEEPKEPKEPRHLKLPKLPKLPTIRHKGVLAILVTAVFLLTPPLYIFTHFFLGSRHFKKAAESAQAFEFEEASINAEKASKDIETILTALNFSRPVLGVFVEQARVDDYERLLTVGYYASQTLYYESAGLKIMKKTIAALSPRSIAVPPTYEELSEASAQFSKGLERFLLLEGELKNLDSRLIPENFASYLEALGDLGDPKNPIKANLKTFGEVAMSLPDTLGLLGPKKYLILLQNNQELRATGGFIGSYAVLDVEDGRIKDFKVDDIYNIDGILEEKGLGEIPPPEFAEYLGIDKIYLRDSNYDPDFTKSAALAKKLYESAVDEKISGVFAINMELFKDILKAIGPLAVVGFGDVGGDNLFEKSVFYAEKNYFKGSQAKKSFLGSLSEALIYKLLEDPESFVSKAMPVLFENLQAKNLLIYVPNSNLQEAVAKRGWGGRVQSTADGDFLMFVEQNVGANKANHTVTRSIKYEVKESNRERDLEASLTIAYSNESLETRWPLGIYKFVAEVVGLEQSFYKEIKPGETWVKTLMWDLPKDIKGGDYRLHVQKQPGMEDTPFSFFYTPILGGREFSWEGNLTKDLEFEIK